MVSFFFITVLCWVVVMYRDINIIFALLLLAHCIDPTKGGVIVQGE